MKKFFKFTPLILLSAFLPLIAHAETSCNGTGLSNLICQVSELINSVIPVLVLLGLAYFIWGIVQYVIADGEEAKKKGKDHMIYGIIGFAVIVGVWGLVNIVTTTFGLKGDAIKPIAPQLVNSDSAAKAGSCPDIKAGSSKFADVIGYFTCLIDKTIIPFIFAIAMVFFIWGAVNFFIINANEESKRAQGRQFMLWAVIALAVMISVWGLVKILALTFGIDTSYLPKVKP
jgi:hypothetical protein